MINTSCRYCIFAKCEDGVQIGCEFDRLEKFAENGARVERWIDPSEDADPEDQERFYFIRGRFCNACRDHEWGEKHPPSKWKEIAEDEFKLQCSAIVYAGEDSTLDEIKHSVASLSEQKLLPKDVHIILHDQAFKTSECVDLLQSLGTPFTWQVHNIVESMDYGGAIDWVVDKIDATYYAIFNAGGIIYEEFLSDINEAINYDMIRMVAWLPVKGMHELVAQTLLHRLVDGNKGKSFVSKIKEIAAQEGLYSEEEGSDDYTRHIVWGIDAVS